MKKKITVVSLVCVLIAVVPLAIVLLRKPKLELYSDVVEVEAGSNFVFDDIVAQKLFSKSLGDKKASDFTVNTSKVDTSKVGAYDVVLVYGKEEFNIKVNVIDTVAPVFNGKDVYVQTNDMDNIVDLLDMSTLYTDSTNVYVTVSSIKYYADFVSADSEDFNELLSDFNSANDFSEVEDFVSALYCAELSFVDEGGNSTTGNIMIVYDIDAPYLVNENGENAELSNVTVEQDDVSVEPSYDKQGLSFKDNSNIVKDDISIAVKDANTHCYTVTLSAEDSFGNVSAFSYDINVTQKVAVAKEEKKTNTSSSGDNGSNKPKKENSSSNDGTSNTNSSTNENVQQSAGNSDNAPDTTNNDSGDGDGIPVASNPYTHVGYRPTNWQDAYNFAKFRAPGCSEQSYIDYANCMFPQ